MKNNAVTIQRESRLRILSVFIILIFVLAALVWIQDLLISSVLGFVLAYLLSPFVLILERGGLSREWSITLVFGVFGGIIFYLARFLSPLVAEQFNDLVIRLPNYVSTIQDLIGQSEKKLNKFLVAYELNLSDRVGLYLRNQLNVIFDTLPAVASKTLTVVILAPFISFFMLKDGRNTSRQVLSLVPNRFFELALSLSDQINSQLGAFIRARLVEAGIVGGVVWAGLSLAGFPYAVFLGIFAALTNLIPYVGPVIGAVPAFVLLLINHDQSLTVFLVTATYVISQAVDIFVVIPMVVAKIVNLHPLTVVVAIIVGAQIMGVLGMLLSIPVASVLKLVTITVYQRLILFRVTG